MQSRTPITYVYDLDGVRLEITRAHTGTAYARNGNVGNPTEYFVWSASLDGEVVAWREPSRTAAYEVARARHVGVAYRAETRPGRPALNVRAWGVVQAEMRANYRGKATADAA